MATLRIVLFLTFWPAGSAFGAESSASAPARGSAEEKAAFEKHGLASDRIGAVAPPPGGELKGALAPGERPSLRFLKKKGGLKTQAASVEPPPHPKRLENPLISPPAEFEAEYDLESDAEVSVTIVGPNGALMREMRIPPGEPGGRKGKNRLSLWDGQDLMGQEAPAGPYHAILNYRGGPDGADSVKSRVIGLRKAAHPQGVPQ